MLLFMIIILRPKVAACLDEFPMCPQRDAPHRIGVRRPLDGRKAVTCGRALIWRFSTTLRLGEGTLWKRMTQL